GKDEGMAERGDGDREEVIARARAERLPRVEGDVARERIIVDRWRLVRRAQRRGPEVVPPDADVAEGRVALLVSARTAGGPAIGDEGEVQVRLLRPHLGRSRALARPRPSRPNLAFERRDRVP